MKLPSLPRLMLTHADFPEQDWSVWEARKFNHPGMGRTIDTSYLTVRPCCIHCATWICSGCWYWRRSRATRAVSQYCGRCGSREGFFSAIRHLKPHEAMRSVPFRVPRMMGDDEVRAARMGDPEEKIGELPAGLGELDRMMSGACPAGDPCPGTGCPACCPTYDPCGEKSCHTCHPRLSGTFVTPGGVAVPVTMVIKQYKDEAIRASNRKKVWGTVTNPNEDAMDNLDKDVYGETPIADAALASGMPVSQDHLPILPHAVTVVTDKIREAHANGCRPKDLLTLSIEMAQELCNLAMQPTDENSGYPFKDTDDTMVIGPECFAQPDGSVISWKGENYYRRQITDEDRKLIAENSRATIEKRDEERRKKLLKEMALHHAVEVTKDMASTHSSARASIVVQTADAILEWLSKD